MPSILSIDKEPDNPACQEILPLESQLQTPTFVMTISHLGRLCWSYFLDYHINGSRGHSRLRSSRLGCFIAPPDADNLSYRCKHDCRAVGFGAGLPSAWSWHRKWSSDTRTRSSCLAHWPRIHIRFPSGACRSSQSGIRGMLVNSFLINRKRSRLTTFFMINWNVSIFL